MTTYYKIRSKENPELFIKGTPYYPQLDKKGRVFQTIGALRTFITCYMKSGIERRGSLTDYVVVGYHDWETGQGSLS